MINVPRNIKLFEEVGEERAGEIKNDIYNRYENYCKEFVPIYL